MPRASPKNRRSERGSCRDTGPVLRQIAQLLGGGEAVGRDVEPRDPATPLVGERKPLRIFMVVVFPAPLGPRKAVTCPFGMENDTSFSAWKLP
jgi:hypothetical protein